VTCGDPECKSPEDEEHGWTFIDVSDARNLWVHKVTAIHFGCSCVYVHRPCKWITVQDCACLDPVSKIVGGRRYSFALDGRHDFVMHALGAGPNVFLDCADSRKS